MFVYGLGCSYRGWGVCIWDGVLLNGIGCYKTGWGVSVGNVALVNGMGVSKRDGVLLSGMGY